MTNISWATHLNIYAVSILWTGKKNMLLLKPFPTTHKDKISLPSVLDLTWCLTFAALLVAIPSAFGGNSSVVFDGNKTKGLNPHSLACTTVENMKCMRLLTRFGLNCAAVDGNSRCAGSFGGLLFHMLALAVIRAIQQCYSSPKSSFYVLLDMERQSVGPKRLWSCIQFESGDATKASADFKKSY